MTSIGVSRLAGAAAGFLLAGCATIFTGTSDVLSFDANVPGVRLTLDGRYQGELPLSAEVSRNFVGGRRFLAKFEKEGYETQQFELTREFNAVAILDISSTIISGGVDVLTGALMKFSPRDYHVQMLEAGHSASSPEFQRSLQLYRFALTNHRKLRTDIARGGGDYLTAFAWSICGGDRGAARLVVEESVHRAPLLVSASGPHGFIVEFDRMLAESDALRGYRLDRNDLRDQ
jgi:hypothetical protein